MTNTPAARHITRDRLEQCRQSHSQCDLYFMQQEALYSMASQLSAAAQLSNAQTLQFGPFLGQPTPLPMPGAMSALQQVMPTGSEQGCWVYLMVFSMFTHVRTFRELRANLTWGAYGLIPKLGAALQTSGLFVGM